MSRGLSYICVGVVLTLLLMVAGCGSSSQGVGFKDAGDGGGYQDDGNDSSNAGSEEDQASDEELDLDLGTNEEEDSEEEPEADPDPDSNSDLDADILYDQILPFESFNFVTTLIGGSDGDLDGTLDDAKLFRPNGIIGIDDYFLIADSGNRKIKRLELNNDGTGTITTLLGGHGFADSVDGDPKFGYFHDMVVIGDYLYIADTQNTAIRRATINNGTLSGVVTIAGAKPAEPGFVDGIGMNARFKIPRGMVVNNGMIYISDSLNHAIRKLDPNTLQVTTIAGNGTEGFQDSVDGTPYFDHPHGLATDGGDYLFVADYENHRIRRVHIPTGDVDTVVGDGDTTILNRPISLYYKGGYLFVIEEGGSLFRMVDLNTKTITTLAGQVGVKGMDDGHPLDEATFSKPSGIWFVDDKDWFLITDNDTDSLRLVHPEELVDLNGYCGDEPAFDNEEQISISVIAVNPINHNLLPAIVLKTTDAIDTTTIDKENLRFTMNGNEVQAYTLEVVEDGQETQLIFKLGEDGKKGWTPGSSYKVKLCHQVLSDSGEPIEPVEIVVTTRPSNQQENIGITHSVNRSGVFYLPTGYDPEQDYPLALLLHGLGGKGHGMVSAFQTLADQMGVILLGPDGFAHDHPFNGGGSFYFNPNHINQEVEDFTFVVDCLEKLSSAFTIDESQVLVAGMSMGAPATLFFSGELDIFSHAAMLHGVRWNFDPNQENDVGNIPFFPWEQTPLGIYRPEFWYSTSVDDWVTNYDNIPIPGLTVEQDLAYIEGGDYNVTHKFDYPGGHTMSPQEKSDLFNWFLFGVAP